MFQTCRFILSLIAIANTPPALRCVVVEIRVLTLSASALAGEDSLLGKARGHMCCFSPMSQLLRDRFCVCMFLRTVPSERGDSHEARAPSGLAGPSG